MMLLFRKNGKMRVWVSIVNNTGDAIVLNCHGDIEVSV